MSPSLLCSPPLFYSDRASPCFLSSITTYSLLLYALYLLLFRTTKTTTTTTNTNKKPSTATTTSHNEEENEPLLDPSLHLLEENLPAHPRSPSRFFPHLGTPDTEAAPVDRQIPAAISEPYTSPALQIAKACQRLTFFTFLTCLTECVLLISWVAKNHLSRTSPVYPDPPSYRLATSTALALAWYLQYHNVRRERSGGRQWDICTQAFWIFGIVGTVLEMCNAAVMFTNPDKRDGPKDITENSVLLSLLIIRTALCLALAATLFGLAMIQFHERPVEVMDRRSHTYTLPSPQTHASNSHPTVTFSEDNLTLPSAYPFPSVSLSSSAADGAHRDEELPRRSRMSDIFSSVFRNHRSKSGYTALPTTVHRNQSAPTSASTSTTNVHEHYIWGENGEQPNDFTPVGPAETSRPFESTTTSPPASSPGTCQTPEKEPPERYKPPTSLSEFFDKFRKLLPFLWPRNSTYLQALIILCMLLLTLGRLVNLLVPLQYKHVVDELEAVALARNRTGEEQPPGESYGALANSMFSMLNSLTDSTEGTAPDPRLNGLWLQILWFVFLRFLQGSVGAISTMQTFMWFPVSQFTTKEISIRMFEHLHALSHRFHLNRKTGEILRAQDRGVASVISLLTAILFNIIPCLADIAIACAYLALSFDLTIGIIVFLTMTLYIIFTVVITDWRTKFRREANLLDNAMQARAVDSLLNFETVKYYNAECFEVQMYDKAIDAYNNADWKSQFTLSVLNTIQNVVIQIGLLIGCIVCAKRIFENKMNVSDFVLYLTYITQLYGPLNWFGSYYRVIQKNFVDMEKMLDLFREPMEVRDIPNAAKLKVDEGVVVFDNVSFAYDPRLPTLRNVSFTVPKGATVALVGPSGGGKSTILRLLFRFYDVQMGRVLVDGQDIRYVKQGDLRGAIGVVPQDTVLFNEDVMYNIKYGKIEASDEECKNAAKSAHIHDRIMAFPDGYRTKVGERGLRLSGGEKQRVAIARTLLKDPKIVLLDEATSALDTHTERHIQRALDTVTSGKTTIVIAHRLSTIVHADMILVLQNGEIVERGSHEDLMQNTDGVYYGMWLQQLRDDNRLRNMLLNGNESVDDDDEESRSGSEDEDSEDDDRPIEGGSNSVSAKRATPKGTMGETGIEDVNVDGRNQSKASVDPSSTSSKAVPTAGASNLAGEVRAASPTSKRKRGGPETPRAVARNVTNKHKGKSISSRHVSPPRKASREVALREASDPEDVVDAIVHQERIM